MRLPTTMFVAILVGCGNAEAPAAVPPPPPPPPATPTAPAAPVVPPVRYISYASMLEGRILSCVEWTLPDNPAIVANITASRDQAVADGDLPFDVQCAEALPERPQWGRCSHDDVTLVIYDFETVYGSDRSMASCMRDGGRWTAEPRDTPAWERARIEAEQRRLQTELDRLNRRR